MTKRQSGNTVEADSHGISQRYSFEPKPLTKTINRNLKSAQSTSYNVAITVTPKNFDNPEQSDWHTSLFDHFRREFTGSFAAIFRDHCTSSNIDQLRLDHKQLLENADVIWKQLTAGILANWLNIETNVYKRARKIVDLLAGSILISPVRALEVLSILKELDFDFEARINCLYLTGRLYKADLMQNPDLMLKFDREIDKLRPSHRWPPLELNHDHLRLLLWRSDPAQVRKLVQAFRSKYSSFNKRSLRLLIGFCARMNLPDEALAFLQFLPDSDLQDPTQDTLKVCMELLHHDIVVETASGFNFLYLTHLLERGLKPDALLYSRVVAKALDLGYSGVAWDIYNYTKTLNLPLHPLTCLSLLKNAFLAQDLPAVDEVLADVNQSDTLYTDRDLILYAMNMVRRLNFAQRSMTAEEGLSHILALYDRVYSRLPLAEFGIVSYDARSETNSLRQPDKYLLAFTVWAYILCHRSGNQIHDLWHHIVELCDSNNSVIQDCLSIDLIYNAFIWLNVRYPQDVPQALEVFSFMVDRQFCLPTSRTWSILICGCLYREEEEQARHMYDLSKAHGFKLEYVAKEFVPNGMSFEDLRLRVADVLDEQNMLTAIDEGGYNTSGLDSAWRGDKDTPNLCVNTADDLAPGELHYTDEDDNEPAFSTA